MSNRQLYRLIKFSKNVFVDLVILAIGLLIIYLARYKDSILLNSEANNIVFLGDVPFPKLILVLLSLILGFTLVVLSINIISKKVIKIFKKSLDFF